MWNLISPRIIMELTQRRGIRVTLLTSIHASLVFGPGSKIQSFDPFLDGYSYGDGHVNTILDAALDSGIRIVDVNPLVQTVAISVNPATSICD